MTPESTPPPLPHEGDPEGSIQLTPELLNAVHDLERATVTEAVLRRLELDLLAELAALLEPEHGPVSEEALAEARRSWPDV